MSEELKPYADDKQLAQQIIQEDNIEEAKRLTNIFNASQAKKNTLRILKYNELLDKISDEIERRVENKPDNFSNSDLLSYLQAIQGAMEKSSKALNGVSDLPLIQLTQNKQINNISLDSDNLSREEKTHVLEFIENFLNNAENFENSEKENYINIIEEEKEDNE